MRIIRDRLPGSLGSREHQPCGQQQQEAQTITDQPGEKPGFSFSTSTYLKQ